MPIAAILTLISNYGPTVARAIYDTVKVWEAKGGPTPADWDALELLVNKPLVDAGSAPLSH